MQYIETFLNILKAADNVIKEEERTIRGRLDGPANAAKCIYDIAFTELAAEGISIVKDNYGCAYIETDGRVYRLDHNTTKQIDHTSIPETNISHTQKRKPSLPEPQETVETHTDDDTPQASAEEPEQKQTVAPDPAQATAEDTAKGNIEAVMREIFGKKESDGKQTTVKTDTSLLEESDYEPDVLPTETAGNNETQEHQPETVAADTPKTDTETREDPIDTQEETGIFAMNKNDFTMYYMHCIVSNKALNRQIECEVISSPLADEDKKDADTIMSLCITNDNQYAAVTDLNRRGAYITAGDIALIVTGSYETGTFATDVRLRRVDIDNGWEIETVEQSGFGTKGHIKIRKGDVTIHVVPTTFVNNATENADYICCIETEKERTIAYTKNTNHVPFECDGEPQDLVCRWADDVLVAMITSPETMNLTNIPDVAN